MLVDVFVWVWKLEGMVRERVQRGCWICARKKKRLEGCIFGVVENVTRIR
jgi:hypothetical protein